MRKIQNFFKLKMFFAVLAITFISLVLITPSLKKKDGVPLKGYYQKYKDISKGEADQMPKYDRPDLAVIQNFEMTRDPQTNQVPIARAFEALSQIRANSILHQTGDVNWNERGPDNVGGRTRAIMYDPNDASGKKVWAGGIAGGLWYNPDITLETSLWQNVGDFWANLAISAITYDPSDTRTFYVGTGEGFFNQDAVRGAGIWKTTDGGQTWSQLSSTDNSNFYYCQKIIVTPKGTVLVATRNGLYRSNNGGSSWTELLSGRFADLEVAQDGIMYCSQGIFSAGTVKKSIDDGISWQDITPAPDGERIELAVAPSNSNVLYAVAAKVRDVVWFKKTTDGGINWTNVTIPKHKAPGLCMESNADFTRQQAWYDMIIAVHPNNPKLVLLGGIDLYKSTSGGSSWGLLSSWTGQCDAYVHADQHAIQFNPADPTSAIFGNDGGVFYSADVGTASNPAFKARNNGYNVTQFYAGDQVNEEGNNTMLAGAQDNGTLLFQSPGINSTTEATGGDGAFCHIDQQNDDYHITAYVYNNYFRSTNGGASYSTMYQRNTGRFINPSDYDDKAKIVYAAEEEDKYLSISNITGLTRANVRSVDFGGYMVSAVKVSPYTDNRVFMGTGTKKAEGGSKIFRIDNAHDNKPIVTEIGTSNLPANGYISSIDVGADDNQILISYSNFGLESVFETRDGGASWNNKEGNLPDIPVRSVLYNPGNTNEALIGTELGVWSTENINSTSPNWVVTNTGLANVRCDMLKYRSSDGTVMVSTHGRGVFTGKPFSSKVDDEPPTIPTNLIADNINSNSFELSWTASIDNQGVTGYNVYINDNLIGSAPGTRYTVSGLDAETSYTVAVEAKDAAGNVSNTASIVVTTNSLPGGCGTVISAFPYTESFENTLGQWEQGKNDDLDWTIISGGTPSNGTGPNKATDGSYYIYLEASDEGKGYPNKSAILMSPCINLAALEKANLEFSYHMNGTEMGSLRLDMSKDGGSSWERLWDMSGSQGESWQTAKITLPLEPEVKLRFTGKSANGWSGDMAIDKVQIKEDNVVPPVNDCPSILFSEIKSQGSEDKSGDYSIENDTTLKLVNNTWRYIDFDYPVTQNTVLEFEFKSTSQGEVHGIGFDTDNNSTSSEIFKLHGNESWGISDFDNYTGSNWVKYTIPVGTYYTGTFNRIVFVNDKDWWWGGNNSYFRAVKVHEGDCGASIPEDFAKSSVKDNYSHKTGNPSVRLYPNPVEKEITIEHNFENATYTIYTIQGKLIHTGLIREPMNQKINTTTLEKGVYILRIDSQKGSWTAKFAKK